ncbi:RARS [Symbiodinium microadriaticum]|nr:RARS [Symbiodinium microadriaticum]
MPVKYGVGLTTNEPLPADMGVGYRYEQVDDHHNYHVTAQRYHWPLKYEFDDGSNIIDAFSPNLNKELHIGHMRNLALASSISRILPNANFVSLLGTSLGVKKAALDGWQKWTDFVDFHPKVYYDCALPQDMVETYTRAEESDPNAPCELWPTFWKGPQGDVIVRRHDGRYLYAFHDLSFAAYVGPTNYITGQEQKEHFESLGLGDKHFPMGLVLGDDGKKMKSRDGGAFSAQEAMDQLQENLDETPEPEKLAWNVLAWNCLQARRDRNIRFEPQRWTQPESAGMYITYTYARVLSALGDAWDNNIASWGMMVGNTPLWVNPTDPEEIDVKLAGSAEQYEYYLQKAVSDFDPSKYVETKKATAPPKPSYTTSSGKTVNVRTNSSTVKSIRSKPSSYYTPAARETRYTTVINNYGYSHPYSWYHTQPHYYVGGGYSSAFWYIMLNEWSAERRARWLYHNRASIEQDAYERGMRDAAVASELAKLKAANTSVNPDYVDSQIADNPDIMYSQDYVEAAYNPEVQSSSGGRTIWDIITGRNKRDMTPLELQYHNPLEARVGQTIRLQHEPGLSGINFNVEKMAVYETKVGREKFYHTDYFLRGVTIGMEKPLRFRLRLTPDEDETNEIRCKVQVLHLYDEMGYDEEFETNVLCSESNDFLINYDDEGNELPEDAARQYWRNNTPDGCQHALDPYTSRCTVLMDTDGDGTIEDDELERFDVTYWDYSRLTDNEQGQEITEFLTIEKDEETGYFTSNGFMQELHPYAIFVGICFLVGFVARTIFGVRQLTKKSEQVEEEVEEEVEIEVVETPPAIPDIDKDSESVWNANKDSFPSLVNPYIPKMDGGKPVDLSHIHIKPYVPVEERWHAPTNDEDVSYPVRPKKNVAPSDQLRKIAAEHENRHAFSADGVVDPKVPCQIRILPPAKNHEVFGGPVASKTLKEPQEKFYYNVIVRGESEKGPQVLQVGPAIHRKIVEAFCKPGDDDISDLVTGRDLELSLEGGNFSGSVAVKKRHRSHAGSPDEVERWLAQASDLSCFENQARETDEPIITAEQKVPEPWHSWVSELKRQQQQQEKSPVDEELRKEQAQQQHDQAPFKGEPIKKDKAGGRQRHFSKGEKVRITNTGCTYPSLGDKTHNGHKEFLWQVNDAIRKASCERRWNGWRPKVGDVGEIVGFVMLQENGDTQPFNYGVAIVQIKDTERVTLRYVCVGFSGLESVDHNTLKNAMTDLREGDWVHWQTQAGHKSVRPSPVFQVRKSKRGNEVQLGYVQNQVMIRFWTPASKCTMCKETPQGFSGLLAHQLPESVLETLMNRDKVHGLIIGGAVGDAWGMPVETWTPEKILEVHPDGLDGYQPPIGHKWFTDDPDNEDPTKTYMEPGFTTDDTQLSKATAKGLIAAKGFGMDEIAQGHVAAMRASIAGWGKTTVEAIRRLSNGVHWSESGKTSNAQRGTGNGIPMKCGPIAVFRASKGQSMSDEEYYKLLSQYAAMTHYTVMSAQAGILHCEAVEYCLWKSPSSFDIHDFMDLICNRVWCEVFEQYHTVMSHLNTTDDNLEHEFVKLWTAYENGDLDKWGQQELIEQFGGGSCYVLHSLPFTYAHFYKYHSEGLKVGHEVIHAGGDTDTNAKIALEMIGAIHGMSIFEENKWTLDGLKELDALQALSNRFCDALGVA